MAPMTDAQLLARLADREDNYTERKLDGVKPEEIRQTVCAFSNSLTAGATAVLFIGIHDKTGAVLGVDNSDTVQKRVREAVDRCYPPITNYAMRALDVGGKAVVAVKVGASANRPHFTSPAYIRRGSESINASEQQFAEMVASRNSKTAAILALRDQIISVRGVVAASLNATAPAWERVSLRLPETLDGKVEACDVHTLRLSLDTALPMKSAFPYPIGWHRYSTSLDRVDISYDEEKRRPLLNIRSDR